MLTGAYAVADGSAYALSTYISGSQLGYKQFTIKANSANAASIFIGGSGVTSAGANAWIELAPGQSWSDQAGVGESIVMDLSTVYLVGTASDKIHISYVR